MPQPRTPQPASNRSPSPSSGTRFIRKIMPVAIGLAGCAVFYAVLLVVNWDWLNRYFLGHPVSVTATALFSVAGAILALMALETASQQRALQLLRDDDLLPSVAEDEQRSPSQRWRSEHDAGHSARLWRECLSRLPASTRNSAVVRRLDEVLTRQSHRTTTGELPEDLRELSMRDADAAHDSLGLIRIIVWAIPMLGFLGTVIGITQTLGGLDFSDGTAAVDRLKSGLYVAFDTTAIGLVLSVVAIFLQFPVERGLQSLLVDIDERVRSLVAVGLPSDEAGDDHTAMITRLCSGIETAVAESLSTQAKLWADTITEAQQAWRSQQTEGTEQFRQLLQSAMKPALMHHADRIDASMGRLDEAAMTAATAMREQTTAWRAAMQETTTEVHTHRRTLLTHTEAMTTLASRQSEQDSSLRDALQLVVSDRAGSARASTPAELDPAVVQAMTTLARAVDTLSKRLLASGDQSPPPAPPASLKERVRASADSSYGRAA